MTVSSSRGTIRSVSSLPSGTLSHAPLPGISCTQSSSRSSSSPIRSPQARAKSNASAARRKSDASKRLAETPVGVDGQVARKRPRQTRRISAEYQAPLWCLCPTPLGDVIEEARNG